MKLLILSLLTPVPQTYPVPKELLGNPKQAWTRRDHRKTGTHVLSLAVQTAETQRRSDTLADTHCQCERSKAKTREDATLFPVANSINMGPLKTLGSPEYGAPAP